MLAVQASISAYNLWGMRSTGLSGDLPCFPSSEPVPRLPLLAASPAQTGMTVSAVGCRITGLAAGNMEL